MKRLAGLILLAVMLLPGRLSAQEEEKKYGITFSGFVKTDVFYDSRQTVNAREGHFMLWPAPPSFDAEGIDLNGNDGFNILSIQTRLKGTITGPDAFGAKTSGVIEGAFFGTSNGDVNGFRLRHAFLKLNWTNTELLAGQYWHPMFVTASFPGTVSFNTGVPFQPFSRNPQVRITQNVGKMKLVAAVLTQRDFTGAAGAVELRNSGLPEAQVQFFFNEKNAESGTELLAGFGGGIKKVVPRLVTDSLYATNAGIVSKSLQGFFKFSTKAISLKLEATYGQNMYDLMQISSYAVSDLSMLAPGGESITISRDYREYAPLSNYSVWGDLQTNGSVIQAGIFAGYTKNTGTEFLGTGEALTFQKSGSYVYAGSRSNIDYVWRVAPRLVFKSGKVSLATELEITTAAFGSFTDNGTVSGSTSVTNTRLLLAGFYFF